MNENFFGLAPQTIDQIKTILAGFPVIHEAIIYGSRAKGNYKNGSDIDLVLKGPQLTAQILRDFELELDRLFLPYSFDLSIFDQLDNLDLIEHINRVGKIFYKIH